jgi:hypothetical protein
MDVLEEFLPGRKFQLNSLFLTQNLILLYFLFFFLIPFLFASCSNTLSKYEETDEGL